MNVNLLFFASLREALGTASERLDVAPATTVGQLRAALAARGGEWARLTAMRNLRCAVNHDMADDLAALKDGDEVAFFPPVTGG